MRRSLAFVFLIVCIVWLSDLLAAFEVWVARRPSFPRPVAWWVLPSLIGAVVLGAVAIAVLRRVATFCRTRPTFPALQTEARYSLPATLLPERYQLPNLCAGCGAEPARMQKLYGAWRIGNVSKSVTISAPFCQSCFDLAGWIGVNRIRVMVAIGGALAAIEFLWSQKVPGVITGAVTIGLAGMIVGVARLWFRQHHYAPAMVGRSEGTFRFTSREFVEQTALMNNVSMFFVDLPS